MKALWDERSAEPLSRTGAGRGSLKRQSRRPSIPGSSDQMKKKQKNADFRTVTYFVRGKMKQRKILLIDGMEVDDFIRQNADDVWLMQNGYYEILNERAMQREEPSDAPQHNASAPSISTMKSPVRHG
jgi:hypothetical protein